MGLPAGGTVGRPLLMVPGPTELPDEVMHALSQPARPYYDQAFNEEVLEPALRALATVFQAEGSDVLILPGSGRSGMEAAMTSVIEPGDPVLVVVAGEFGRMLADIASRAGAAVGTLAVDEGRPLDLDRLRAALALARPAIVAVVHGETSTGSVYPLDRIAPIVHDADALLVVDAISSLGGIDVNTDGWQLDVVVGAPHKCLAGPLGVVLIAVNPRAWDRMRGRAHGSFSYTQDLLRWKRLWIPRARGGELDPGSPRRQPVGLPTQLTAAVAAAVELTLREGLAPRFERHTLAGAAVRAGLETLGFEIFPDPAVVSSSVTCARVPVRVDVPRFLACLKDRHGVMVGGGFGKLAASVIRIGTMGLTASARYVLPTLSAIELTLEDCGHGPADGRGVAAAQRVFAAGRRRSPGAAAPVQA